MRCFVVLYAISSLCYFNFSEAKPLPIQEFSGKVFQVDTPAGEVSVYEPSDERVKETASIAKAIFIEAFSTVYREYHRRSDSLVPVEEWLDLKPGLTLPEWLTLVFDEEYEECLAKKKHFLYLSNSEGSLVGWLSYTPVSKEGDVYMSQCAFSADYRNHKVASTLFQQISRDNYMESLFPGVKEIKVITRKINRIAQSLFENSGFMMDETMDPRIYGQSYDERYIGFRFVLAQ